MVSLPVYKVEPPDILMIEMLKMVPLPPYRIDIYDVLQIRAIGTLLDQPIDGFFLVEGEGIVTLGPAYGRVHVAGMTVEEAAAAITARLRQILAKPEVSVQLARTAGTAPVTGEYLIGPDGTINLRQYGTLHVAGKTITEIRQELNKLPFAVFRFARRLGRGAAIQQQGVLRDYGRGGHGRQHPPRADHRQRHGDGRLKRGQRSVAGVQHDDLGGPSGAGRFWLRADLAGRLRGDHARAASSATNYQIMPGDRVFVAGDDMIAANTWLEKMTAPIERLLGMASLGTSSARSWETLGREYNRTRF